MTRLFVALGVLAGCAPPPAILPATATDPASSTYASTVQLTALDPVAQPALPRALRPSEAAPPPSAMTHTGTMAHDASSSADSPLSNAVEAYLTIHAALATDTVDGLAEAARAFEDAFALAIQAAPATNPHVWHSRSGETAAVQEHARALAVATSLDAARAAFGALSAPFANLLDAVGTPDGVDLVRHTCGMRPDLPDDGVWLQRGGPPRNPYFGSAMQMCSSEHAPAQRGDSRTESPADHVHGS